MVSYAAFAIEAHRRSAANALLNLGPPETKPETELPFQKCSIALHQRLGNYKAWLLQRGKHVFKNAGDRCHPKNFVEGIFEEGIRRIVRVKPLQMFSCQPFVELDKPLNSNPTVVVARKTVHIH